MKRVAAALFLAVLVALPVEPGDEPGVQVRHRDGVTYVDTLLPGVLVSYALPRVSGPRREIVALVSPRLPQAEDAATEEQEDDDDTDVRKLPPCPEDRPASELPRLTALYRIDTAGSGRLVLLRDDLPAESTALDAADLDGDGRDELLLARHGELFRIDLDLEAGSAGEPTLLVEDPALRWSAMHPRIARYSAPAERAWAAASGLGSLVVYGPADGAGPWQVLARAELPLHAGLRKNGIRVSSPPTRYIGADGFGRMFFATPPQKEGGRRLRTVLVTVEPSGESAVAEAWSNLPYAENVLEHSFLMIDDRPVLLVTTKPADKLNLFGEKGIRIFPLRQDRSRLGMLPLFAADSRMNLWQTAIPRMVDVDADGDRDLVIGYWKGIKDDKVVLDVYLREGDEGFSNSPRTTAFNVEEGDRSFVEYGADLNGNGFPDLLVRGEAGLLLYAGRAPSNGRRLVETEPRLLDIGPGGPRAPVTVTISTGGSSYYVGFGGASPRTVDLDGDGRPAVVLARSAGGDWHGVLRIARID